MFMSNNIAVGKYGEDIATEYLKKNGYKIIERNFKKPWGEIDVVCSLNGIIVFVEVKTQNKSNRFFIRPEENITPFKQRQLIKSANAYLAFKKKSDKDWQIDIIAIELGADGSAEIRHLKNAISE